MECVHTVCCVYNTVEMINVVNKWHALRCATSCTRQSPGLDRAGRVECHVILFEGMFLKSQVSEVL